MWFISAIVLLAAGSAYGQLPCALDICFLVDGSSSIGRPNWNAYVIPFLKDIVTGLKDAGLDVNVGIQLFSSEVPAHSLNLTSLDDDLAGVLKVIGGLPFLKGFTDIATGIRACQDNVLGGVNNRADAKDMIVLISDGVPTKNTHDTIPAANYAKIDHDTYIISVAVGTFSQYILEMIATNAGEVIQIDDYPSLIQLLETLIDTISLACGPPVLTTTPLVNTPNTVKPFCTTKWCDGSYMPPPPTGWNTLDAVELEWTPLSDVDFPDGVDQPPEDLFELEQYVAYFASHVWYTNDEAPVYTTTTSRTTTTEP